MGRAWTTPDQKSWLNARIPEFLKAQCDSSTDRFHQLTSEAWFQTWPEGDTNASKKDAITKRKKQLQNWFSWNSQLAKRTRSSKSSAFMNIVKQSSKRTRLPRPVEAYQRLYPQETRSAISSALKEAGDITKSKRLEIIRRIPAEMLSKVTPEVLADVNTYIEQEKEKKFEEKKGIAAIGSDLDVRTAVQINRAIQEFPLAAHRFLESVAAETGWVIHLIAAGPNPAANGEISSIEQYFGPKLIAGNTFQQAHAGYGQHVERPFLQHVQGIFPPEICLQRATHGLNIQHSLKNNGLACEIDLNNLIPIKSIEDGRLAPQPSEDFIRQAPKTSSTLSPSQDSAVSSIQTTTPNPLHLSVPNPRLPVSPPGYNNTPAPQVHTQSSANGLEALIQDWEAQFGTFLDGNGSVTPVQAPGLLPGFQQTTESFHLAHTPHLQLPFLELPPTFSPRLSLSQLSPLVVGPTGQAQVHVTTPSDEAGTRLKTRTLTPTAPVTSAAPAVPTTPPTISTTSPELSMNDYTINNAISGITTLDEPSDTPPAHSRQHQEATRKLATTITCETAKKIAKVPVTRASKRKCLVTKEVISKSRPRRKIQAPARADRTPSPPPHVNKSKGRCRK